MFSLNFRSYGLLQREVILQREVKLFPFPKEEERLSQQEERTLLIMRDWHTFIKVYPNRACLIINMCEKTDIKYRNVVNFFLKEIGVPLTMMLGKDGVLYLRNDKTQSKSKFIEGMPIFLSGRQLVNFIKKSGYEINGF
jgi:hypothetical protein